MSEREDEGFNVRLLEHLTSFVWNAFDRYKEDADLARAKAVVAEELQRCAAESFMLKGSTCAWLRLSWIDGGQDPVQLGLLLQEACREARILTMRWLGSRVTQMPSQLLQDAPIDVEALPAPPRTGEVVAWAVVACSSFDGFLNVVANLKEAGVNVRDANYGGVVL